MTTWEGFDQSDLELFEKVAKGLRRKAHGVMDEEDLYQSCALWALEHKGKYAEAKAQDTAHRLLWSRMSDLIRQERARVGGWEVEDQFSYAPKALRELLPKVFEPEWMVSGQDYDRIRTTGGADHTDPADAWVLVADVRAGYDKLPAKDQALLARTVCAPDYAIGCQAVAASTGEPVAVVQRRVDDALRKLGRKLRA